MKQNCYFEKVFLYAVAIWGLHKKTDSRFISCCKASGPKQLSENYFPSCSLKKSLKSLNFSYFHHLNLKTNSGVKYCVCSLCFTSQTLRAEVDSSTQQAEPLVVSRTFLSTQPCNLVVLRVIKLSLFIVIVFLALWLACPWAGFWGNCSSVSKSFWMIVSLADNLACFLLISALSC